MINKINKMNKRDRDLLFLLAIVIIIYICYAFIISPSWDKGKALNAESTALKSELNEANDMIANVKEIRRGEKKLKAELTEKYKVFFYDPNEEKALFNLDSLMVSSGLVVDNYAAERPALVQINYPASDYKDLSYPLLITASKTNEDLRKNLPKGEKTVLGENAEATGDTLAPDVIPVSRIDIGFSSVSYEAVFNFIKALENQNKAIMVEAIDLSKDDKVAGIQGNIKLALYTLPKLDEAEKDFWKFASATTLGKSSPFN